MSEQFDGRGLKCPLAFVKAKQALVINKTKVYLLDDRISLYNFVSYLDKLSVQYTQTESQGVYKVVLNSKD